MPDNFEAKAASNFEWRCGKAACPFVQYGANEGTSPTTLT